MSDFAIQTENLTRSFGKLDAVHALNLEVPHRSIYAFLGPNGAGKSTTLSMLVNALRPSSGRALVLGRDSTCLSAQDFTRIGYVAEHQELPDWMTGEETLKFLQTFYPKWDVSFLQKLQQTLDVPLGRRVRHMSRGEQMRLRLISSMAYRPELLILDEPFSGLDPSVRDDLSSGLLELVGEEDWTVILASHDVDEVERLADHAGFIHQGRMQFSEGLEDLQRRFRRVTAFFTAKPVLQETPSTWSAVESGDRQLRFVDEAYDAATCRAELEKLGPLEDVEERPLTLREIFIAASRRRSIEVRA